MVEDSRSAGLAHKPSQRYACRPTKKQRLSEGFSIFLLVPRVARSLKTVTHSFFHSISRSVVWKSTLPPRPHRRKALMGDEDEHGKIEGCRKNVQNEVLHCYKPYNPWLVDVEACEEACSGTTEESNSVTVV